MGYVHVGGRGVAAPPAGSGGAPGSAHYAFNGSPFPKKRSHSPRERRVALNRGRIGSSLGVPELQDGVIAAVLNPPQCRLVPAERSFCLH